MVPALTLQPIVENAVRHGITKRKQGGTIRISTGKDKADYWIRVEDDGMGYQTVEKVRNKNLHIGIANVTGRVESMCGGTVTIESIFGEGTDVLIRIPRKEEDKGEKIEKKEDAVTDIMMQILVVDDEEMVLEETKETVGMELPGMKIIGTKSALEAVNIAGKKQIEIAFLDIEMPDMDGLELAEKLKKKNPNMNIIFVSAYAEYALEAFDLYASGYLLKPLQRKDVERAIRNLRHLVGGFRR